MSFGTVHAGQPCLRVRAARVARALLLPEFVRDSGYQRRPRSGEPMDFWNTRALLVFFPCFAIDSLLSSCKFVASKLASCSFILWISLFFSVCLGHASVGGIPWVGTCNVDSEFASAWPTSGSACGAQRPRSHRSCQSVPNRNGPRPRAMASATLASYAFLAVVASQVLNEVLVTARVTLCHTSAIRW